MKNRICALWLASFAVVITATAQALPQGSARQVASNRGSAAKKLAPGQVDTTLSRVYVFVGKERLGHEHAVEGQLQSGSIELGSTYEAGKLVFDMTSFSADTNEARKFIGLPGQTAESTRQKVNTNMLGPDVLHVKRFPTATFNIDSVSLVASDRPNAPLNYVLEGSFTMHSVERPLKVTAQAEEKNGMVHLRGNFVIRQSMFGIKPYSTGLGAIGVADELKIHGDIWIAK